MKMIHIKQTFILLGMVIFTLSCTRESVLSDVPVTTPNILRPVIRIDREVAGNGSVDLDIRATIYDRNNDAVNLLYGNVFVNGEEMRLKYQGFFYSYPYYSANHLYDDISSGELFQFQIQLSNSAIYPATINIQDPLLNSLTVPVNHDHTQDMIISWSPAEQTSELVISLKLRYNTSDGVASQNKTISIPVNYWATGSYTISADYFDISEIYQATVKLTSTKSGELTPNFSPLSVISSTVSVEKSSYLY